MPKPAKASVDFLTQCYMRDGLLPFLHDLEQETLLRKKPFSVLVMDVDHFKVFNDKYGHLAGDDVLKYFASSMRLDLEAEENSIFRFGGDEFVVVFPLKDAEEAAKFANRLRRNMRNRACLVKGVPLRVTFSGGIACFPDHAKTIEQLFEKADQALYFSKNHGRARVTCYHQISFANYAMRALIVLAMLAGMAGLYFFMPTLTKYLGFLKTVEFKINLNKKDTAPASVPVPISVPAPAPAPAPESTLAPPPANPVPPAAVVDVVEAPATKSVVIYLRTGRAMRGNILSEDDQGVVLSVALKEGRGKVRISRSEIVTIQDQAVS